MDFFRFHIKLSYSRKGHSLSTTKPVKMCLLYASTSPCLSTATIYTALLSTVYLALFLLHTYTVKTKIIRGRESSATSCKCQICGIRRMTEQWKLMISAAKTSNASINGNDALVEGDSATDVSTGNTGAQSWMCNTCRVADSPTIIIVDSELEICSCCVAHARLSSGQL